MKSGTLKTESSDQQTIDIHYERVGIFKRISAALFDLFVSLVVGLLILILTFYLVPNFSFIQHDYMVRETVSLRSGLYVKDGDVLIRYTDYLDGESLTVDEKSLKLDEVLFDFYSDDDFVFDGLNKYLQFKNDALSSDGKNMFDIYHNRALNNDDYDDEYYNFYLDIYDSALSHLANDLEYSLASREIMLTYILAIVITFLIPLFIFYCIIPLFFKRTRQTFGMKLVKISLINVDGFAVKTGKYVGRMFFFYLIIIVLSIFAFLLPLMLNIGFLVISKSHQTFVDYVFNTYSVDTSNDKIFFDYDEYLSEEKKRQMIRIEDKNYQPAIKK